MLETTSTSASHCSHMHKRSSRALWHWSPSWLHCSSASLVGAPSYVVAASLSKLSDQKHFWAAGETQQWTLWYPNGHTFSFHRCYSGHFSWSLLWENLYIFEYSFCTWDPRRIQHSAHYWYDQLAPMDLGHSKHQDSRAAEHQFGDFKISINTKT